MNNIKNEAWIEEQWEEMKLALPIGYQLYGDVISIKPFGVFVDVGYEVIDGYIFSGIIDIGTKDDHDSSGLPFDYLLWPKIGERIYCKVVWHRDGIKEVSLSLVKI
jgi:ribosomal protein S1